MESPDDEEREDGVQGGDKHGVDEAAIHGSIEARGAEENGHHGKLGGEPGSGRLSAPRLAWKQERVLIWLRCMLVWPFV